jgi:peptidyl-dipeptidase A
MLRVLRTTRHYFEDAMNSGFFRVGASVWSFLALCILGVFLLAWIGAEPAAGTTADRAATAEEARAFADGAEKKLLDLWIKASRASWVQQTFITDDTQRISADADLAVKSATAELAAEARRFDGVKLPEDVARKLMLLRLSVDIPAPRDAAEAAELARIDASLKGDYGKGKWCPDADPSNCLNLDALEKIMATSRDPEELKRAWIGWHSIAPPMRQRYERMVVLGNKGARELGFADMGAQWRSNYDMPPEKFAAEIERLWQQVRPLYESLHAYVRTRLREKYGAAAVPADGPIPAHLLGNMWAQGWTNIYPLVAPPQGGAGYDLTEILKSRNLDAVGMVKFGEQFFVSLGFEPLPETFWKRSMFTRPRDRDVVCHASAWSIDFRDDLRVKMCIQINDEDFTTVHHELGHNFYQRAYNQLPPLFQGGANDGFHEAVGDTIALSITPDYLHQIGLLEAAPSNPGDLGFLMNHALDKVAFLPFGLLIDQWRWKVFSGEIKAADYNKTWWELKRKYQGVAPPVERSEADFDPGAKYHVAANVPYTRYFLAAVYQYQFHRALCRAAGYAGPLHHCSIYGNKAAGARLKKMLEMGQSEPWPDALEAISGERDLDASAILEYYAPLKKWLDEQNAGHPTGW